MLPFCINYEVLRINFLNTTAGVAKTSIFTKTLTRPLELDIG